MKELKIIVPIFIAAIFFSCSEKETDFLSFSGFTQGTTYSVIYRNTPGIPAEQMQAKVEKLLREFDNSLSTYNAESVISKINANIETAPDSLFLAVFNYSRVIWEMSDGAFDITAGPLVNAWGFGPDAVKRFNESKLDSLMDLVGMDKISLVDGMIVKENPSMYLDVNAIAQGYSVDVAGKFLESMGIFDYLVEVGGEVRTRGKKSSGEFWKIAVDKPIDNNIIPGENVQTIVSMSDKSLATSGNYRKFYLDENGVKYSHTIDPRSGYPVRHNLLSATIIADDCMTADAIATTCMVLGLNEARDFLLAHPEFEGYLVYSDEKGELSSWFTEGMMSYISD